MARVAPAAAMSPLAVAGRSDLLFAAAELIERGGGKVSRRIVSAAELCAGQLAPPELLERLGRRRDAIAGLVIIQRYVVGEHDHEKRSESRRRGQAEELGQKGRRLRLVLAPDDRMIELRAHGQARLASRT